MFGLLKKKFNDLSEKIFGKSKEKIDSEKESLESSENQDLKSSSDTLLKETASDSVDSVKEVSVEDTFSDSSVDQAHEDIEVIKDVSLGSEKEPVSTNIGQTDDLPVKDILSSAEKPSLEKKPFPKEDIKEIIPSIKKEEKVIKKEEKVIEKEEKVIEKEDKKIEKEITVPKETIVKQPLPKETDALNLGQNEVVKETSFEIKEPSKAYKDLESKKVEDVKKSTLTKIKSLFSSKVKLSEKEISDFLDDFEISLLEADVSIDSSSAIIEDLKKRLLDFSFSKSNLLEDIKEKIKETLKAQLNIDCDIENYIKKEKEDPLIILIIGPNGAGKTTTISKFAHLYKEKGKSVVLASSDTFRAGSIDQLEIHAKRLGVRVVKQNYGSDPAAVAFDAVASAKANKNDVVLIDTAGRQDTNINLMQELSKIKRVVKPHLTIYIGESQAGQAIVEQIEKFDKEIGITGVILTKIDTDPKGGVAISILNELKKPIFYIGTGQEYQDIEKFSPEYIIERII